MALVWQFRTHWRKIWKENNNNWIINSHRRKNWKWNLQLIAVIQIIRINIIQISVRINPCKSKWEGSSAWDTRSRIILSFMQINSSCSVSMTTQYFRLIVCSNLVIPIFTDLFSDYQVVLKGLLGSLGFKVVRALSGKEAVELMSSRPHLPDLILLDVEMPSESGHEVFAAPLDRHEKYTFNLFVSRFVRNWGNNILKECP